jgi:hypothetical protein
MNIQDIKTKIRETRKLEDAQMAKDQKYYN